MRETVTFYRFSCDEDGCHETYTVERGDRVGGLTVHTAEDADSRVREADWHARGGPTYCPAHARGRR